jgi:hypothetical protein
MNIVLTDQMIRDTVAKMNRPADSKAAILKAALAGDGPSRFVVMRDYKAQHGISNGTSRMTAWLAANGMGK